jgi:hypothetical protein
LLEFPDCRIELVENYPCKSEEELIAREGYWMRQVPKDNLANKQIAGRTLAEYRKDNKEKIAEYSAEYYETNKEKILEYHAEYYETNKKKILEKKAEYREDKREAINAKQTEKIECECGCMISRTNISKHRKTQKHQDLLAD